MKEKIKKILLFCLSSFSSFLLDYMLFTLFRHLLPQGKHSSSVMMTDIANVAARIISATFNYVLNTKIVFGTKKSIKSASSYFALALFILVFNTLILTVLTKFAQINPDLGKLITETIMFIFSYLIQSKVIFKNKEEYNHSNNEIGDGAYEKRC